jgi:hypothetical protein
VDGVGCRSCVEFGGWGLISGDDSFVSRESSPLQLCEAVLYECDNFRCWKRFLAAGLFEGLSGGEESAESDAWEPLDGQGESVAIGTGAHAHELSAGFECRKDSDGSAGLSCGERKQFGVVEVVERHRDTWYELSQFGDDCAVGGVCGRSNEEQAGDWICGLLATGGVLAELSEEAEGSDGIGDREFSGGGRGVCPEDFREAVIFGAGIEERDPGWHFAAGA